MHQDRLFPLVKTFLPFINKASVVCSGAVFSILQFSILSWQVKTKIPFKNSFISRTSTFISIVICLICLNYCYKRLGIQSSNTISTINYISYLSHAQVYLCSFNGRTKVYSSTGIIVKP